MVLENKIAIYVLNKQGLSVAKKIVKNYQGAKVFVKEELAKKYGFFPFLKLKEVVYKNFHHYRVHIFICATGIVVRILCHLISSKDKDPAVLVIDPRGKFVISLISGHLGGANFFTQEIANNIGAIPVITTATDSMGLPAIDNIAREIDLIIDDVKKIKTINSAILDHKELFIYDPLRILNLNKYFSCNYPLIYVNDPYSIRKQDISIICDYKEHLVDKNKMVLYPKILYVGIGCNKYTSSSEILDLINNTFSKNKLSLNSIAAIVTTDKKKKEKGIIETAKKLNKDLIFIDHNILNSVDVPNPSKNVKRHMGVYSVCEAASIIASKGRLLVEKIKSKNVTLAISIRERLNS